MLRVRLEGLRQGRRVEHQQRAMHCMTGTTCAIKAQQLCVCSCHACPAKQSLLPLLDRGCLWEMMCWRCLAVSVGHLYAIIGLYFATAGRSCSSKRKLSL